MKKKMPSAIQKFLALSDAEKDAEVAQYDREFAADAFRAPPLAALARHRKVRRRGRPPIGEGAEKVLVTIERGLLAKADARARAMKISRSELIAAGLQRVLARRSA